MVDITSSLLANAYSGFSPLVNVATVVCNSNGRTVPCLFNSGFSFFPFLFSLLFILIFTVPFIMGMWKMFEKASQKGWASIVPIYSYIILLRIIKKPSWWIFLLFIPIVSTIIAIVVTHNLSKAFGKGVAFTVGLIFLPFIFYPILGFGNAVYIIPKENDQASA